MDVEIVIDMHALVNEELCLDCKSKDLWWDQEPCASCSVPLPSGFEAADVGEEI